MTRDKQPVEGIVANPQKQLTKPDLDALGKKLDATIASKAQWLDFTPSGSMNDPNSTINLSRFGLKNPGDLKTFLLSPAGETVKKELKEELELEKAIQEQLQMEQQETEVTKERLRAFLLHWLLVEKGHSARSQRDYIELLNQKAIQNSKEAATSQQKSAPKSEPDKGLQEALGTYTKAILAHQAQQGILAKTENTLIDKLHDLKNQEEANVRKYATYQKALDQLDESADEYEESSPADLDRKIAELEEKMRAQTDYISTLVDNGKEDEARELLNQQNALNLQIANLHDIRAMSRDKVVFFNDQGEVVDSRKKADYVLPLGQKLEADEHGKLYLLEKGQNLKEMSVEEKNEAHQKFNDAKAEIMTVKKTVQHVKKQEMEFHTTRIKETDAKLAENRAEQLMLQNQITLLQAAHAKATTLKHRPEIDLEAPKSSASQGLNATPVPVPSSSSSKASSTAKSTAPAPSPQVIQAKLVAFVKEQQKIFDKKQKPTWGDVLDFCDKIPDKKAKDEANKYLKEKHPNIADMPRIAPMPHHAINALLQHMARFAANAYQVGNDLAPMDKQKPNYKSPTPFDTPPSGG